MDNNTTNTEHTTVIQEIEILLRTNKPKLYQYIKSLKQKGYDVIYIKKDKEYTAKIKSILK